MTLPTPSLHWKFALVGYGEVGQILAEDLRRIGLAVAACDLEAGGSAGAAMRRHAADNGVSLSDSHSAAVAGADLVISAVTASQTVAAAAACASALKAGAFFLDFNSASPAKRSSSSRNNVSSVALLVLRGSAFFFFSFSFWFSF